jgi:hypothetical protein
MRSAKNVGDIATYFPLFPSPIFFNSFNSFRGKAIFSINFSF